MRTISPTLVLCCLAIASMAFINAKPVFATTYCQTVSLTSLSSSCPNPPGGGSSYPIALPRGVTLIGVDVFVGGGSGGFYSGGTAGGQETASISSTQVTQATAAAEQGNYAIVVLYNGPTTDVSFVVLLYQPASGTWYAEIDVNNSGLTLSQLKTLAQSVDFIQKVLDAIGSQNANINLGPGGGPGSNPDGGNNLAFIEITGSTVCYGSSTRIAPASFTVDSSGTVNLGEILVNGTCP